VKTDNSYVIVAAFLLEVCAH